MLRKTPALLPKPIKPGQPTGETSSSIMTLLWTGRNSSKGYSDAKVILNIRDTRIGASWPRRMRKTGAMVRSIVKEGALRDSADKEATIAKFEDNIARVKQLVPRERMLVFHVGDG
ncbi:Uncharacterized protein TCAP_07213 [Tolypocladium capitatum]|uniref:Uncharacterized protein n=1 Tax=Tolypocladium capitatum TaxID=45235 RepID=A0A2K3Q2N4_9HYPO|nr:Uncharacterized protein TCAP_07213 [Tolypocladium capitatum]